MRRLTLAAVLSACAMPGFAQWETSGQLRAQWDAASAASDGPLAAANVVAPGTAPLPSGGAIVHSELHASRPGFTAVVTLEARHVQGRATNSRGWVNELVLSHDAGAWQFALGKKVVAWDVGYGFRPNDMVQQEARRSFASSAAPGRPVLAVEHFNADTAWSLVWVNPTHQSDRRGAQEPALAARVYRRDGALDWHGFARIGARTGAGVGAAVAWVATDALELHGSWRYQRRVDTRGMAASDALAHTNPWQAASLDHVQQLLIGTTWTHASQISVMAEAWWDGSARSDAHWREWSLRNRQLAALAGKGPPAAAIAGNLAWQADAFGASSNVRRGNVFLRMSWQSGAWQPALDLLYTPADAGRLLTASLAWQGDRVSVQAGVRAAAGPRTALLRQLPNRVQQYVNATWAF
ncbi:hypothetical protein [Rhodoferax sp.]|uniref:hypothetical protein n=1 Tax=Rhodoferax sp. TaxID=50421 RepID=UPI00275B9FEF|nr:hypothetical protein [Rhodoferax sp.]